MSLLELENEKLQLTEQLGQKDQDSESAVALLRDKDKELQDKDKEMTGDIVSL